MVSDNLSQQHSDPNAIAILNGTFSETPLQRAWLGLSVVITAFGLCATSLVLAVYALDRDLSRNLFHIYVKNLLPADWFYFAVLLPVVTYVRADPTRSYPSWVCSLWDYAYLVIASLPAAAHVCISVNRFWAMTFPQAYRERHSVKAALGHCAVGVTFFNVIGLPTVAIENARYADVRGPGCAPDLTDQSIGILNFVNVLAMYGFLVLVVGLYPYLWWKNRMRHRMKVASISRPRTLPSEEKGAVPRHTGEQAMEARAASHAFNALSWLTSTVFLFWTPFLVYAGGISFVNSWYDADLLAWLNLLFSVQTMCDPLIFLFSLKDFHDSFTKRLKNLW